MENSKKNSEVFKPKKKEVKKVSFVWLIPLVVLFALCWLGYESYMQKGTNIVVTFKDAEGIKKNVTMLEYKGIQLGKVTNIVINDDLRRVDVHILVDSVVAGYVANENSRFWVKKPRIGLTKVSGLSTLLSGYKIELSPKKILSEEELEKFDKKVEFVGLDSEPANDLPMQGYFVNLIDKNDNSVSTGTPIFYKNFQIGEIVSKELKYDKLLLKAYIYDNYHKFVNQSSKFVLNEALNVSFGPAGLSLKVGSLYSAIVGGVTVVTPKKDAKKIPKDEMRILYSSKDSIEKRKEFDIVFDELDGIGKDTPIIYKGIKIGGILNVALKKGDVKARAYLIEKYSYFLTKGTKFFVQKPEVSLKEVKNLGNIIKGNFVSLIYSKGEFCDSFKILSKDEIDFSKEDIVLTLSAKNLNSITKKSKIYYKNIQIGKVLDFKLSKNLDRVLIKVSIDARYKDILNDHILFYDLSSKLVQMKNLNLHVNYSGLNPLMNGGIGIVGEKRKEKLSKKEFKLFSSFKDVERLKRIYNKGFTISAYYDNDFEIKPDMSIRYKNQEIGFVKSVKFNSKKSKVNLFIYKKFQKYITNKSRFYKKSPLHVNASLSGLNFEIDSFSSLLNGSLELDTSSNIPSKKFQIFSSYDDMKYSSNSVSIIFDDVEGLQKDFSRLTYKGVSIGKVIDMKLLKSQKIKVKAIINENYNSFARDGTIFFLKKPKISLNEVSNVGSTVMAVNIGVIKGNGKHKRRFKGYDKKPLFANLKDGRIFKIEDKTASSIGEGSPIYYKNVQIGKVLRVDLKTDGSRGIISCLIWHRYAKLIRQNSKFYDISGFEMKFSIFSGSEIESNTFTSLLKGGLVVVTPEKYGKQANSKSKFILHKTLKKGWKKISPKIK